MPHRPGGPPHDLGEVDADVLAHLLARGLARVGVDGEAGGLTGRPDRVVGGVVVRQAVPPHGRDHHAPDARLARQPLDLLHPPLDVVGDGHEGDAAPALRAVAAHLDQEAVVGPGPGVGQLGVVDHPRPQPGAERGRGVAGDGVGVGEHHLGRHAVRVHLLVPLLGVEGTPETLFVVGLPAHDVVVVELQGLVPVRVDLRQVVVEAPVVALVEVLPVALGGQPAVGVRRDDRVAVGRGNHGSALLPEDGQIVVALVDEGDQVLPGHGADDPADLGRGPLGPVDVDHPTDHEVGDGVEG